MLLHVIKSLWSHQSVPMMGRSPAGALTSPKHLSPEPHYVHDEMSDASTKMIDMAPVDSKIMMFLPTKKALQAWRHPGTAPSHDSESVCTEPTVDTNGSVNCTNDDKVILPYFQSYLDLFLILNQNWMPVWKRCLDSIQINALQ
jgi:hypothetical protein